MYYPIQFAELKENLTEVGFSTIAIQLSWFYLKFKILTITSIIYFYCTGVGSFLNSYPKTILSLLLYLLADTYFLVSLDFQDTILGTIYSTCIS